MLVSRDRRKSAHGNRTLTRTLPGILVLFVTLSAAAQTRPTIPLVTLSCDRQLAPLAIDHIALGQGGLSAEPMFHSRVAEIRALHPGPRP